MAASYSVKKEKDKKYNVLGKRRVTCQWDNPSPTWVLKRFRAPTETNKKVMSFVCGVKKKRKVGKSNENRYPPPPPLQRPTKWTHTYTHTPVFVTNIIDPPLGGSMRMAQND